MSVTQLLTKNVAYESHHDNAKHQVTGILGNDERVRRDSEIPILIEAKDVLERPPAKPPDRGLVTTRLRKTQLTIGQIQDPSNKISFVCMRSG